jgi:Group II intron, maturase-specific domain
LRWRDHRSGSSPDSALPTDHRSSAPSRQNPWSVLSGESGRLHDVQRASALMRRWRHWPPDMRGWRSYFGFCETPRVLASLTSWVRARLRVALWRQWKTTRRRQLSWHWASVQDWLGTAGSSRGPWYLAHAKALSVALPTAYLQSLGLPNLEDVSYIENIGLDTTAG